MVEGIFRGRLFGRAAAGDTRSGGEDAKLRGAAGRRRLSPEDLPRKERKNPNGGSPEFLFGATKLCRPGSKNSGTGFALSGHTTAVLDCDEGGVGRYMECEGG